MMDDKTDAPISLHAITRIYLAGREPLGLCVIMIVAPVVHRSER